MTDTRTIGYPMASCFVILAHPAILLLKGIMMFISLVWPDLFGECKRGLVAQSAWYQVVQYANKISAR